MKITILTLFPDMFSGFLSESIIGRAQKEKLVEIETVNLRKWGIGKHKTVDDTPYGGGAGMVLRVDVVGQAIKEIKKKSKGKAKVILLTPQGEVYHQKKARMLAEKKEILSLCVAIMKDLMRNTGLCRRRISTGDYILTGGEIAAALICDSVVRLLPGVSF